MIDPVLLAFATETAGRTYGHAVNWGTAGQLLSEPRRPDTDCSITAAAVLWHLYGDSVLRIWPDLMITDAAHPFSPVHAAVLAGLADWVDAPPPGAWCLVQGWRALEAGRVPNGGPRPNGHTFLYRQLHVPLLGAGLLLNANTSRPWVREVEWDELIAPYRAGVKLARLRLEGLA